MHLPSLRNTSDRVQSKQKITPSCITGNINSQESCLSWKEISSIKCGLIKEADRYVTGTIYLLISMLRETIIHVLLTYYFGNFLDGGSSWLFALGEMRGWAKRQWWENHFRNLLFARKERWSVKVLCDLSTELRNQGEPRSHPSASLWSAAGCSWPMASRCTGWEDTFDCPVAAMGHDACFKRRKDDPC